MNSNTFLFIVCIIIGIICAVFFIDKTAYTRIPKKIWTFWDGPSQGIDLYLKNWAKWNPDYEIVVLTRKNYKGYVTIPERIKTHPNFHDTATRFSELVRVWTLAEHGGVWINLGLMNAPLTTWLFSKYAEFAGYEHNGILLPSFFACNKGCIFMQKWRDEFSTMIDYDNVEEYTKNRTSSISNSIQNPIQNAIQVASIIALDQLPDRESLIIQNAENGPYQYLVKAKWDSEKALRMVCQNSAYGTPLILLREQERRIVEQIPGLCRDYSYK